jgi:hypothetical protein
MPAGIARTNNSGMSHQPLSQDVTHRRGVTPTRHHDTPKSNKIVTKNIGVESICFLNSPLCTGQKTWPSGVNAVVGRRWAGNGVVTHSLARSIMQTWFHGWASAIELNRPLLRSDRYDIALNDPDEIGIVTYVTDE